MTIDSSELWGAIITAWIVIAMPAYFAETARSFGTRRSSEDKTRRESHFTRLSLWWSAGLVLLFVMRELDATAIAAGTVITIYLIGSLALRALLRSGLRTVVGSSLAKRGTRIVLSILFLWLISIQSAAVLLDWYGYLSVVQLVGINVFPPLIVAVAYACLRWVRDAKVE